MVMPPEEDTVPPPDTTETVPPVAVDAVVPVVAPAERNKEPPALADDGPTTTLNGPALPLATELPVPMYTLPEAPLAVVPLDSSILPEVPEVDA